MLNFLATTENLRNIRSKQPNDNRGKVVKKAAGNCYSQFPDILSCVRSYFLEWGGGGILVVAFKL